MKDTRISAAITLINSLNPDFGLHITRLIQDHQSIIADDLSLGSRDDLFETKRVKEQNTEKRVALRALLLCQRVYFSELWPKMLGAQSVPHYHNTLGSAWKTESLTYWKDKSIEEIKHGISAYYTTSRDTGHVSTVLNQHPCSSNFPMLTITRENCTGTNTSTCYDAVMLWLFRSGLVSLPWLIQYKYSNTKDCLNAAFGSGRSVWNTARNGKFLDTDTLGPISAGMIIHMYDSAGLWRGHWMISLGGTRAAGVNNDEEGGAVQRTYSNNLSIDKQFRAFFENERAVPVAAVIDPSRIPDNPV